MPEKLFVARKDKEENAIFVVPNRFGLAFRIRTPNVDGTRCSHEDLLVSNMRTKDWSWIWADEPPSAIDTPEGFHARMQFRHRMMDVPCVVRR